MSRYRQLPPDPRAREKAAEIARDAGRMGAMRVPDAALFHGGADPSDSQILAILTAFEAGQLERRKP